MKKDKIIFKITGAVFSILGFTLAIFWFGWEMALVLFFVIVGNNIERSNR